MKFKTDSLPLGLAIGIIAPIIVFFGYYFIGHPYMSLQGFINYLVLGKIYSALISLCVVANLGTFFLFIQKDKYFSARGIILATFIYAGLVFYLKFFT